MWRRTLKCPDIIVGVHVVARLFAGTFLKETLSFIVWELTVLKMAVCLVFNKVMWATIQRNTHNTSIK